MGAHHYDIAQWALDFDATGPTEIIPPDDPSSHTGAICRYANGIEIVHGGPDGCTFHGENGTLRITRGHLSSDPAELTQQPLADDEIHLEHSPGHHRNWLDCVHSRKRPLADVEAGARTAAIIHLANAAYWNRHKLRWDPDQWKFLDAADNALLDRERRDPWQLPG
jgi:predicted dehydrogenase